MAKALVRSGKEQRWKAKASDTLFTQEKINN
jgi:hypothetical protein